MQSVISPVDHESRSNFHNDDVVIEPTEETPLLVTTVQTERDIRTIISVGVLVFVLIVGAIIGVYLLVLQNDAEHILPPDIEPIDLLRRSDWDDSNSTLKSGRFKARRVEITQTDTEQCFDRNSCATLLNGVQVSTQQHLPYNFLVSTNGLVLEALGWGSPSPQHPNVSTLVIALIGNFTEVAPKPTQVRVTANFVSLTENQGYLYRDYKVVIHNETTQPNLYQSFKNIPHFSRPHHVKVIW